MNVPFSNRSYTKSKFASEYGYSTLHTNACCCTARGTDSEIKSDEHDVANAISGVRKRSADAIDVRPKT